jgi:uncharacterized membrane protein
MKERSEANKLSGTPIVDNLGGEDYNIFTKTIAKSRIWKEKSKPIIAKIQVVMQTNGNNMESAQALIGFLYDTWDEVMDLVFEWEETLPKEKILETATEEELFQAVIGVINLAFPLVKQMGLVKIDKK